MTELWNTSGNWQERWIREGRTRIAGPRSGWHQPRCNLWPWPSVTGKLYDVLHMQKVKFKPREEKKWVLTPASTPSMMTEKSLKCCLLISS